MAGDYVYLFRLSAVSDIPVSDEVEDLLAVFFVSLVGDTAKAAVWKHDEMDPFAVPAAIPASRTLRGDHTVPLGANIMEFTDIEVHN